MSTASGANGRGEDGSARFDWKRRRRELQSPCSALARANFRRAVDLLHQPLHQSQAMPLAVALRGKAYAVIDEADRGFGAGLPPPPSNDTLIVPVRCGNAWR